MDDPTQKVEVSAFDAARLRALETYAQLEMSLAGLLIPFFKKKKHAYSIFFRITNSRSRYAVIEALLRDLDEPQPRKFWRSIEKKLVSIDGIRNNIVHWIAWADMGVVDEHTKELAPKERYLSPGHTVGGDMKLSIQDIHKFRNSVNKVNFFVVLLSYYLSHDLAHETREALHQKFLQRLDDLTQEECLQILTARKPSPPPQSSPE